MIEDLIITTMVFLGKGTRLKQINVWQMWVVQGKDIELAHDNSPNNTAITTENNDSYVCQALVTVHSTYTKAFRTGIIALLNCIETRALTWSLQII